MKTRPDEFKNVIGTIIRCEFRPGNPAEDRQSEALFYAAYHEIIVISTGSNKAVPEGRWRIRLVTYKDRTHHPVRMGRSVTFIAADPDATILGVESLVHEGELAIKVALHSEYTGNHEEILLCGTALMADRSAELVS